MNPTLKGKRANIEANYLENDVRSHEMHSVPALVFGPYLALHHTCYYDGSIGPGWMITHIPTGLGIMPAKTQKHGRLLIERLLPLDWTPEVAHTNGPAVRRIAADVTA